MSASIKPDAVTFSRADALRIGNVVKAYEGQGAMQPTPAGRLGENRFFWARLTGSTQVTESGIQKWYHSWIEEYRTDGNWVDSTGTVRLGTSASVNLALNPDFAKIATGSTSVPVLMRVDYTPTGRATFTIASGLTLPYPRSRYQVLMVINTQGDYAWDNPRLT